jgi:superfamily I DNA and RNA helicase
MVTIINGSTTKPASTLQLSEFFKKQTGYSGVLYTGYPIMGGAGGPLSIDAIWVSREKGVIVFCLEEGRTLDHSEIQNVQDESYRRIYSKLVGYKALMKGRQLQIGISVVTFAPARDDAEQFGDADYPVCSSSTLESFLSKTGECVDKSLYEEAVSIIQSVSSIRKGLKKRIVNDNNSRGSKLKSLEDSIANLDNRQGRAVIESVEGVQRIRGLAGSGKTIVLALKAAYLYAKHPEWKIAVTFHSRSLKGQYKRFINSFVQEQTGEEPDWENLEIIHAWGSAGKRSDDGLYHRFCIQHGCECLNLMEARRRFGIGREFAGACEDAVSKVCSPSPMYDAILIDEAQDFPASFLRMCYAMLCSPKRLVYAYDELQNLRDTEMPAPEKLFGVDQNGVPLVSLSQKNQDCMLEVCYRNSGPVLTTAHAIGFGLYKTPPPGMTTGIVQMFERPNLWEEVGYKIASGRLSPGEEVDLCRSSETSPDFLSNHSSIDDLIQFLAFDTKDDQDKWVAEQVRKNLVDDELMPIDVVVINPNPVTTKDNVAPIRAMLYDQEIATHVTGVDTTPDVFFDEDNKSVAFTGIFRAKGNEAGMVYVVNAHECYAEAIWGASLARNRLFTAITRSKAWVRVVGVGEEMKKLQAEFYAIKRNNFHLKFRYPNEDELKRMRRINRDMTKDEERQLESRRRDMAELVEGLKNGSIVKEDLDPVDVAALKELLG